VPEFKLDDQAHQYEHSIEVQLPFLQQVYQNKKFKIVPVAIGYSLYADLHDKFSRLRDKVFGQGFANTLILVSSDFSHDTPKDLAYKLDAEVIEKIVALRGQEFYDLVIGENRSVCGVMPISAMLILLQNSQIDGKLLYYSTSMDVMEHERGVGYAAVSFEKKV
jgi:AmmeMemoRadiSam system protein B